MVKILIDHLALARYLAASREGDIRIKEFLQAITILQDGRDGGPITLEVSCHFRSWQKSVTPVEAADLGEMPLAELADTIAAWVQDAINQNLLSLSDPPRAVGKEAFSVGSVFTCIYGKDYRLVGTRWS